MFTGISENIGTISKISTKEPLEYSIKTKMDLRKVKIGSSIMCSGICLTVIKKKINTFSINISEETLKLTTAKDWKEGTNINLERSLKVGDELGGHIVTGHVDAFVYVEEKKVLNKSVLMYFSLPNDLNKFVCKKGSVTLDGVSLTVNDIKKNKFSINLIPHTCKITTLGNLRKGDKVNIEVDILARYIDKNIIRN